MTKTKWYARPTYVMIAMLALGIVVVLAAAGAVSAKAYDFTNVPLLHEAVEGYDDQLPADSPPDYDEELSSDEYTAISASDNNRAEYYRPGEPHGEYDFHRFKFEIDEDPSVISQLYVRHEGYGYNEGSYGLELFIWNYATSSWESVGYQYASDDDSIEEVYGSGFSDYVDGNGYLLLLAETKFHHASCPYLYAWNGAGFEFIDAFNTPGGLGYYDASAGQPYLPKSEDYVKIDGSQLKAVDGVYRLEVAEDQDEVVYFDQVKLLVVDHPQGTETYTPTMTKFAQPYSFKVYTIRDPKPPISAVDDNGVDILPVISKIDRIYTEGEDFHWDSITLNLGDLSGAEEIKLVFNAYMDWPLAPAIAARYMSEEYRARVEVINEDGEWEEVSLEEPLGLPQAEARTYVVDITDWFKTDDYRVRISYWEKALFDYIVFDTSEDEEVLVSELNPISADLHWKGVAKEFSQDGRKPFIADYYTIVDTSGFEPFAGNFTKYGDVLPLLTQVDDKFVVMHAGDDISLAFNEVPASEGTERDYFLFSDAYYKLHFARILLGEDTSRVEPLPFHGMSAYPYPGDESYPYDAEHMAYLEEYNTRQVVASPPGKSEHHTIYTDYVKVEVTSVIDSEGTTVAPIIDGGFGNGEWTNAQILIQDPIHTYVYFKNDASFLYVCVDAANAALGDYTMDDDDHCTLYFDTDNNGAWTAGHDDVFRISGTGVTEHFVAENTNDEGWGWVSHCTPFNHVGLEAMAGFGASPNSGNGHRIYEFKIPLDLLGVSSGDTIGFASPCPCPDSGYDDADPPPPAPPSIPYDASTGYYNIWPATVVWDDMSTWGDLILFPCDTHEDVWVDDGNPPEDDSDGDAYFHTIKAAVCGVRSGGTVHVAEGSYVEEDVQIGKPLSLLGAGCALTDVSGNAANYVFYVASDDVTISGFSIHNGYWQGIYLHQVGNCHILDNCIYECEDGIYIGGSSNNTIGNNEIHHNGANGMWLWGGSSNNTIEGNNIYENLNDWSCPFVYSWDGSEYHLDSQLFADSPGEELYYDGLDYLAPVDGQYLLKLTEEMYETGYVDEVKLITVDHPAGTQAIADRFGTIHTIQDPYVPMTAVEENGIDCLEEVTDSDGIYWTSSMHNKDFGQEEDLRDGVILTFDKPAGAETAKLLLRWRNTPLFEQVVRIMRGLPQGAPGETEKLSLFVFLPFLEVWNGDDLLSREMLSSPGSSVDREDIQVVDISGITGDEVTIKLESLTGLLMIDSVAIDFSVDEEVYLAELSAVAAVDGSGTNIVPQLLSDDASYFAMTEGDYADLSFAESAVLSGYDRSYLIKADGYYDSPFETGVASETRRDLLEQFLADPNYAMRYSLETGLERERHCGIYIGESDGSDSDCDSNEILENDIHNNNGEGIYLDYADHTLIKGNNIYSNEDSGMYLYRSSHCEMYCNDIYMNNPTNLTGIHLDADSHSNMINYNNIYGNVEGVVNDNSGDVVDATNNWWGTSDGPGGSGPGTGDNVSSYVSYDPWLAQESTVCPLDMEPTPAVGGDAYPINKVGLVAPWIALAVVIAAGVILPVRRRAHN